MKTRMLIILLVPLVSATLLASDWPVYKGNMYYTGNNDEITVKNNNLKWLYQASDLIYNPIVSDGRVYFVDIRKNLYCLHEDSGKLLWKKNLTELSSQFTGSTKTAGKVKYPLVKDNKLILSDNYVIYCLDKRSGDVLWARSGMRDERKFLERDPADEMRTRDMSRHSTAIVDGIYSDPVIAGDMIYYGTRNIFIAREIERGHMRWNNTNVKSYSGFPSFYDDYIFTQSMDYLKNVFTLYCLNGRTGAEVWSAVINRPERIFSPVVYRGMVYLASDSMVHCFRLADGQKVWAKDYGGTITSNPSFTEREILFSLGNRSVLVIRPADGSVSASIDHGEKSSPYFVTIRDQMYVASTFMKKIGDRGLSYASLRAVRLNRKDPLWEFVPPFPGGAYQPVASGGIMFLPAGNYLYAVGTDYYSRIIDGGSTIYDPYNKRDADSKPDTDVKPDGKEDTRKPVSPDSLRTIKITVTDREGRPIPAAVEVKKWDNGKPVYSRRDTIKEQKQEIRVPDTDDVEITAETDGYVPKKAILTRDDSEMSISLDRIEKGKSFVVDNIHFEIDEAYLMKESLNILDRMIDEMKRNPGTRIEIRGHTDSTGTREHNMKLSERRADSVREYMVKNGISPGRLESAGYGPDKPIADNKTIEGRRKNRRTEFFILDK